MGLFSIRQICLILKKKQNIQLWYIYVPIQIKITKNLPLKNLHFSTFKANSDIAMNIERTNGKQSTFLWSYCFERHIKEVSSNLDKFIYLMCLFKG